MENKTMSNASDFVIKNGVLKKYVGQGGDVVVPANVTSIGMDAFGSCTALSEITLPKDVTSIEVATFYNSQLKI